MPAEIDLPSLRSQELSWKSSHHPTCEMARRVYREGGNPALEPTQAATRLHDSPHTAVGWGRCTDSSPIFSLDTPSRPSTTLLRTDVFNSIWSSQPGLLCPQCAHPLGCLSKLLLPCSQRAEPSKSAAPWEHSVFSTALKKKHYCTQVPLW